MNDGNWQEELKYVPHHKMGFKLLGEAQMENMFPGWKSLVEKIGIHRSMLEKLDEDFESKDSQYYLMYDNIFSIMGKRGSGKTSAVFTLKSYLKNHMRQDRVLPIIMPEVIPKGSSMIGWVLALLEQTVKELNEKLRLTGGEKGAFSTCLYHPEKSLQREYEEVKELCFSQHYQGTEEDSLSRSVMNYERVTQNSFDFSQRLTDFWNSLVRAIKKVEKLEEGKEPLIFLIFDDVDLVPDRVVSLFSTIIKYLSHPNLIVFVTADEELLYDVIEKDLNQRLGKYEELCAFGTVRGVYGFFNEKTELEMRIEKKLEQKLKIMKETPRFYCDKVLPPACRYYLESFESCARKSSFLAELRMENGKAEYVPLGEFVRRKVDDYIAAAQVGEKVENFLVYEGKFINAYLSFFGNTARQLANEKLILEDFLSSLAELQHQYKNGAYEGEAGRERYMGTLHKRIGSFMYNSLNADASIGMQMAEIKELINSTILQYPDYWGIYIQYYHVKEWAEEQVKKGDQEDMAGIMQKCMAFYSLLFFIENILLIESKSKPELFGNEREKIHGLGKLRRFLEALVRSGEFLVYGRSSIQGVKRFLYVYEKIFETPEVLFDFDMMTPAKVRNYFYSLPVSDDITKLEDKSLQELYMQSPGWLRTMTGALFLSREGVFSISKNNFPSRQISPRFSIHDSFFDGELGASRKRFIKILCEDRVLSLEERNQKLLERVQRWREQNWQPRRQWESDDIPVCEVKLSEIEAVIKTKVAEWKGLDPSYDMLEAYMDLLLGGEHQKLFAEAFLNGEDTELLHYTVFEAVCNKLKEALSDMYQKFEYYVILDEEEFQSGLDEADINMILSGQQKRMRVLVLNRILTEVTEKLEEIKRRARLDDDYGDRESILRSAYGRICENVSLSVKTEEEKMLAVQIVALHKVLGYFEEIYLNRYMDKVVSSKDGRIDPEKIPYKVLYEEIKKAIKDKNSGYLGTALTQYIREYADQYYTSIVEG